MCLWEKNKNMRYVFCFLFFASSCFSSLKQKRDEANLLYKEKEFAEKLSIRQRKIFCRQFTHNQRQAAISYAKGNVESCYSPDEAVFKVMEETGMSLAMKRKSIEEE